MLQQGQDLGEVNEVSHKSTPSAPVFTGNFNFLRSTPYLNTGDCTLKRSQIKDVGWCVFTCRNFNVHCLLIISVNFPSLASVLSFLPPLRSLILTTVLLKTSLCLGLQLSLQSLYTRWFLMQIHGKFIPNSILIGLDFFFLYLGEKNQKSHTT